MDTRRKSNKDGAEKPALKKKASSIGTGGNNGNGNAGFAHRAKTDLEVMFDKYRDMTRDADERDVIWKKGIILMGEDLGVTDEVTILLLPWKLQSCLSWGIQRGEWFHGLTNAKVTSHVKLRSLFTQLKEEVGGTPEVFGEFYGYLYDFLREDRGKHMDPSIAMEYWQKLLAKRFKYLKEWTTYVETAEPFKSRGVSRDLWKQLYEFAASTESLAAHEPDGPYPVLIDDFVEWARAKK
eukprot:TRINITY_DN619_c11_g1_i1.p2 TRINITY_DN619_c11_g1~~TRINITY_DN619_c11_g1_i1.p2  ORF type:complete len:248 (+),score=39.86 TRINITY_DN619_c11_g1_i1:31-744(+)